jgi:hypothetical protein
VAFSSCLHLKSHIYSTSFYDLSKEISHHLLGSSKEASFCELAKVPDALKLSRISLIYRCLALINHCMPVQMATIRALKSLQCHNIAKASGVMQRRVSFIGATIGIFWA